MISTLTTTYNRANLLRTRIASTLNQTFKDFELVIIDGFSNDNNEDIVRSFKDKRLNFILNKVYSKVLVKI
jgi:glycosyltransferase involved in cell wall biosynthesis